MGCTVHTHFLFCSECFVADSQCVFILYINYYWRAIITSNQGMQRCNKVCNKQGACLYFINTSHLLHIIIKTHFVRFYNQKSTRFARGLFKRTRSASVSFWDVGTRVACLYSIYLKFETTLTVCHTFPTYAGIERANTWRQVQELFHEPTYEGF